MVKDLLLQYFYHYNARATDAVVSEMTSEQKELVNRIIKEMNPASARAVGALFDNRAELPGDRIAIIRAPSLIFHAKDDTLQRFHNAEFAAANIPGAKLMSFEKGGHLLLAIEQAKIQAATQKHILECANARASKHRWKFLEVRTEIRAHKVSTGNE